jgi:hypothetical protein
MTNRALPGRDVLLKDENSLVQSFRRLNEYLEGTFNLFQVDCVMFLHPFHQVITSEHANGALTSAALSALSKFALYGFLSSELPRAKEGVELIAECISKCVFEESDWQSDEVVLVKILELSTMSLRCDAASHLTVATTWEIYSTCISIHNQYRASKFLRAEAETALRHLTLTLFSRAHIALKYFGSQSAGGSSKQERLFEEVLEGQSWATASASLMISAPVGITLLLGKIMTVLSGFMDPCNKAYSDKSLLFALSLLNIALEAGGVALSSMLPLVTVLRGDVCRHLLRASQSDDLAVFSVVLRVVYNLFVSIKDHMKTQLEVFLTSVHLRLLRSGSQSIFTAREELALESLLEFCREPALMQDMYTNYDCDVQCTNLFDAIISTLCVKATPKGASADSSGKAIRQGNGEIGLAPSSLSPQSSAPGGTSGVASASASASSPLDASLRMQLPRLNILNELALHGVLAVLHTVGESCGGQLNKLNTTSERHQGSGPGVSTAPSLSRVASTDMEEVVGHCLSAEFELPNLLMDSLVDIGKDPNNPKSAIATSNNPDELELSVDEWCSSAPEGTDDEARTNTGDTNLSTILSTNLSGVAQNAESLKLQKLKKQRYHQVAQAFNASPLKLEWLERAVELDVIPGRDLAAGPVVPPPQPGDRKKIEHLASPEAVAHFLKNTPGLGKTAVGEFISKGPEDKYPYHARVLRAYVDSFSFDSPSFSHSLRTFLGPFRLPGEAQVSPATCVIIRKTVSCPVMSCPVMS